MSLSEDDNQVLLSVSEAAQLLRIAPGTLYHMLSQNRVPGVVRLSRRCVRLWRHRLLQWAESNTDGHTINARNKL